MSTNTVQVRNVSIGADHPLVLIAGPCVLEDHATNSAIAKSLLEITTRLGIPFIFKASYDKGNRGVSSSYRGPMLDAGLDELAAIRSEFDVPVLTDVHSAEEARRAAEVVDILQVPAYLCMQTSLIEAAASTGKPLNVKKGQFLAPKSVAGIVQKVRECNNEQLLLTERGTFFGYHQLVSDIRSIPTMRSFGTPIVFDPTHIIRNPGISSSAPEGGNPEFVPHLTRAAVAAGIDALFIETHPTPSQAKCDACSMYPLPALETLLQQVKTLDETVKQWDLGLAPKNESGFLV